MIESTLRGRFGLDFFRADQCVSKIEVKSTCKLRRGIKYQFSTSAKGSITVEAAMAVPIFFLAVVCLLYLIEMMAVQTAVRSGLQYAGKKMAQECAIAPFMTVSGLEKDVVEGIGAARLERSIVEGGSAGIDCSRSQISSRTGIANLQATYKICVPIPLFHIKPVNCSVNMKVKAWTGYEKEGFGDTDEDTVYIAETGIVYHRDYHCAYLDLTIMSVSNAQLETMRNREYTCILPDRAY